MYFLVKNIRSCSKQLRKYGSLEKHNKKLQNDFIRFMSYFTVHPEKLKQAVKERDAHMLCQFFDSEEYKKRVTEFLEMQSKILSRNSIAGTKASNVEYQHVLSCAQPSYQAAKTVINEKSNLDQNKDDKPRKRRIKKGTIIEQMLMTKSRNEVYEPETNRIVTVKNAPAKKVTHRTTIMPIFLKKLRNRQRPRAERFIEDSYKDREDIDREDLPGPAKEIYYEEEPQPMYAQILQRSDLYRNQYKTKMRSTQTIRSTSENSKVNASLKSYSGAPRKQFNRVHKSPSVATTGPSSTRLASSISHKPPSVKLCPKKNMNLKSYSELLLVEPVKCRSSKAQPNLTDNNDGTVRINIVKPEQPNHSTNSLLQLVQETQKKKQLTFDMDLMNSEINVKHEPKNKRLERELQLVPLYKRLKIEKPKEKLYNVSEQNLKFQAKSTNAPDKNVKKSNRQSYTYKIVSKHRSKINQNLKEKFRIGTPFWAEAFVEGPIEANDLDINQEDQGTSVLEKNIAECLHKPISHIVECANNANVEKYERLGYHKYLLRLPKTTPEGYRVLMYAVRDGDPTKMNFNDVVKGFCMYNDCVLSEDGLQEGYIVIFDMKDVCLGHLARVSLPALKCFLWYIQDAHPARIKGIHVLNTATWIHHVMKLVVPLVRSELLNMVKFHKGSIPDKFPIELLPMDYGGEAPTVEDLDRETKSLLDKYKDWLIESAVLKADESKRAKKAGWWGFFSGKSAQQAEIDEKNILKNLQID